MVDIAMCRTETCPHFKQCYRAQAEPNEYRQSYADFDVDEHDCFDPKEEK